MAENVLKRTFLSRILESGDLLIALFVVIIVVSILIPLPSVILDMLLLLSLFANIFLVMTALYVKEPKDFGAFPTLLVFTTLLRLGLNVATTKMILTQGPGFEGKVVTAFADFVVGGNFVVGIIVFAVITAVQFLVMSSGVNRLSEVAARFKLDQMQVRIMLVDSAFQAGKINEAETERRKNEILTEANFYGAMDGAGKMVKGDVQLSLVLIFINVIAGLVIGVAQRGEAFGDAAQDYVRLSIGDGLVAAIPSFLVSFAAAILATRGDTKESLGKDITLQFITTPRTFWIAAGLSGVLAVLPGFPHILLGVFAVGFYLLGNAVRDRQKAEAVQGEPSTAATEAKTEEDSLKRENLFSEAKQEPMELELGYELIPLVQPSQGGDLLERVKLMRRQMVLDIGLVLPQIRILDNMQLQPDEYVLKIKGESVGGARIRPKKLLAINGERLKETVDGESTVDPIFGAPAWWIGPDAKREAEGKGFSIIDPTSVVVTHIVELAKANASELLSRKDVNDLLAAVWKRNDVLEADFASAQIKLGDLQKVLQDLLSENVSIRNLDTILETVIDRRAEMNAGHFEAVAEHCRFALRRQICARMADAGKNLHALILSVEYENELRSCLVAQQGGAILILPENVVAPFRQQLTTRLENLKRKGHRELIITSHQLRRPLQKLLRSTFPRLRVMADLEVDSGFTVDQAEVL